MIHARAKALWTTLAAILVLMPVAQSSGAVIGKPKQAYADRPDDKPCQHVQVIGCSPENYTIEFRGTVDGVMTRMPIGYSAYVQGWQPNRSVLIENVGQSDVHNPQILVNGKRNWRSAADIVADATRGYTAPADRARAIWEFWRRQRFHACTWDNECSDAVKALNVYGYTLCGNEAQIINDLWRTAGLTTRRGYPVGHCVTEVFYDGAYHLLDSDEHVICLNRDNQTIAGEADIVRDHDLVKRTHTYSIGAGESRGTDEFSASLYGYEGERKGQPEIDTRHVMDLALRPGESIEFRWDHIGKQYTAGEAVADGQAMRDGLGDLLAGWGPIAYDNLRNGKLRYRPDLAGPLAQRGTAATENARYDTASASVRPEDARSPASVTWRFASPHVFVGGKASARVRLTAGASAEWRYSTDQKTWQTVASSASLSEATLEANLDRVVSPRRQPTYRFWLQLVLRGNASASKISFENDIQTSLLGLPELEAGTNRITYADANTGQRQVRVTHRWLEQTAWHAPQAPAEAVSPRDGQSAAGSRVTFQWSSAVDPDGDAVVDYHFELSEHQDMRWPLSPNFEKLTSLTPSRGKPQWTIPSAGLLHPNTTYFWRVRARDGTGVWGPWSRTFRFSVRVPGVPLDMKLSPDGEVGFQLTWRPNSQGEPPVAYKVYGSDERGFSASDTEHVVLRGKGFVKSMDEYVAKRQDAPDCGSVKTPANLIARVTGTALRVVGPDAALPNTNKAYYRVVAVDAAGSESGPSDYAEVPRPFVFTQAPQEAQAGTPYRYQPGVIRSLGDLRCRPSPASSYNAAFWDREELTFAPIRLPEGLTLDPKTGAVSGTPTKMGAAEVAFKVSDQFGKSRSLSYRLTVTPPPR